MTHFFSPYTGEIIRTDTPADWMLQTDIAPPSYEASTHGCFWRDGSWVVEQSAPDAAKLAIDVRRQRNGLIAQCDWTQLTDAPLTAAQKAQWKAYRQVLRDISAQTGFPVEITWPVAP